MPRTDVGRILWEWRTFYRDPGDAWGSVMGTFFDVAGELWNRGDGPPDAWEYSRGAMGGPAEVSDCVPWEAETSSETLEAFGNVLLLFRERLVEQGRDY